MGQVGLRQQGYTISDDEVDQLMGRMDMDGDGSLDFEELATALLDWDDLHCSEMFGEALDKVFAKLDTNNKGYLDYTDLMVLLPADLQGADQQTREAEVFTTPKRPSLKRNWLRSCFSPVAQKAKTL